MNALQVKNPYTGTLLAELPFAEAAALSRAVDAAAHAFQKWRHSSAWERSRLLLDAAQKLDAQREDFAQLICAEAGKPITLARLEVDRAMGVLKWSAAEAERFAGELLRLDIAEGRSGLGIHTRFPRGVVLGITPFNFPLNLMLHKVAPAIACGCSILIKPSVATPLTAQRALKLFESAPSGLVQVVLASDGDTAELTRNPKIATISFTGSSTVGWLIRKQAPEKPITLELGGNAWVVLFEDTPAGEFSKIAKKITSAAYGYAGQSCISVQNAAVASSIWPEFEKHLVASTEAAGFGDPKQDSTLSGPVISSQAADRIRGKLAQLPQNIPMTLSRASIPASLFQENTLIPPTLIHLPDLVEGAQHIVQEEIFAPIMTVQKWNDLPSLIQRINSSPYGLQTGIFTQNWPLIHRLYRELEVGGVIVNDVPTTRYDHQPYGGVKQSGQGREGIRYAMDEMTESKFLALP